LLLNYLLLKIMQLLDLAGVVLDDRRLGLLLLHYLNLVDLNEWESLGLLSCGL